VDSGNIVFLFFLINTSDCRTKIMIALLCFICSNFYILFETFDVPVSVACIYDAFKGIS